MRRVMWCSATALLAVLVLAPAASAQDAQSAYGKRCRDQQAAHVAKCVTAMARLAKAQTRSPKTACAALPRKPVPGSRKSPYSRCVKAGTALIRHGNGIDRAFVDAMIAHHLTAVKIAEIGRSAGQTAFVRGLAASIVTAHNRELGELRKMSAKLKAGGIKAVGLGLTRAERGVDRNPSALVGANPFDIAFVDMMIAHHQAAITISKALLEKGVDKEARDLAGEIVSALTQEVQIMKTFRAQGPGSGGPGAGDLPH